MLYDAVLMVTPDKLELLQKTYFYLCKNLGAKKVILVANSRCKREIEEMFKNVGQIEYLDENEILDGLNYESVKKILCSICGNSYRTGWFFQQFLKMAYAFRCKDDYYLVFDADTVALNPISYFDSDGRPQFIVKREYYNFYFHTIDVLFDGEVKRMDENVSYIAENMMISKQIMLAMINDILANEKLEGRTFYEKILRAVDRKVVMDTGFSEFETYGNYVMRFYPETYAQIRMRTQRLGSFLLGQNPSKEQLEWMSKDYDIVSFERHGKQWLARITKCEKVRKKNSAKTMFDRYIKISNFCDVLMHRPVSRIDD